MTEEKGSKIILPVEWYYSNEIISRYANNFVVQHTEQFGAMSKPPLAGLG